MKKGFICKMAVCSCISAMLLSSCAGRNENTSGEETKELSYWAPIEATLATQVSSYNDVSMYKKLEEKTGVHINFIHPAAGQEAEQFNLLLTSGNMPDMIEYRWSRYTGGVQKAIDDGIIIALNDYLDYCPNYKKALTDGNELSDIYMKNSTTDSGMYYGFTALNTGNYRIFGGPCIRRDLLKKYNLEMPETIDDWTNVLTVFKENGVKSPITGMLSALYSTNSLNFAGAFGVSGGWYVDGEKMKFGPMENGFKDYLSLMHKWYESGLIDKDLATNTQTLVDSKIVNGDSAALLNGFLGSALGRYLPQKLAEDSSWDLTGAAYPVRKSGEINEYPTMEPDVNRDHTIGITTGCKNPEAAVRWCDNLYSDEGYMLVNFGVEGEDYNLVEGKPVYTDKILNNADGLSINEALLVSCRATSAAPGFNQAPEYLEQYYQYEQQKESFKMWEANTEAGRKHVTPILYPTAEESDIIATISADMNIYVSEQIWNFVTGAASLDKYDEFRSELKNKFRFDEYLEIMQNQYDRYCNR